MNAKPFQISSDYIAERIGDVSHDVAIVLGSGLGGFVRHLGHKIILPTSEIPGYPQSAVQGHVGELVSAEVGSKRVLVFSGRVHFYENRSTISAAVTAIVSHSLGIGKIILTNAAGILNRSFNPGDLMVIDDQINMTFRNVLKDMGSSVCNPRPIYSQKLQGVAIATAEKAGVNLKSGVYLGLTGPSYETPAEVRMYRLLGADSVGMSTIHEAMFARSVGMEVLGISCLTNYSTGLSPSKLSHEEVTDIGAKVDDKFSRLLMKLVQLL